MFKYILLTIVAGLPVAVLPELVSAADTAPVWVVTLNKGAVLSGKKVSENKRIIVIDVHGESISIFKNAIISIDSTGIGMAQKQSGPPVSSSLRQTVTPQRTVPTEPQSANVNIAPPPSSASPKQVKAPQPPITIHSVNQISAVSADTPQRAVVSGAGVAHLQKSTGDTSAPSAPGSTASAPQTALPRPKPRFNVTSMSAETRGEPSVLRTPNTGPPTGSGQSSIVAPAPVVVPASGSAAVKKHEPVAPLTVIPAPKFGFVVAKESRTKENVPAEPVVDKSDVGARSGTAMQSPAIPATGVAASLVNQRKTGDTLRASLPPPPAAAMRQIEPLVIVKPPPLLRTSMARDLAGTASVPPSASPPSRTSLAIVPQPALQIKRKRSDGQQELLLVDGTMFVGKTVSQTERAFVFSSEGAIITIFKHLVRSIDGEPFIQTATSAAVSANSPAYPAPVIAEMNRQSKKRIPVSIMFRILPVVELPQGSSVAQLVDSITKSADPASRSRAARYCGAMGPWAVSAVQALSQLLSDTARSRETVPLTIDSTDVDRLLPPGLEAARALSQLGLQGESELLNAFSGTSQPVRIRALFGLGTCFFESAEKAVRAALKDPEPVIRLTALGSLRVTTALLPLLAALSDADPAVRAAAVTLLGRLDDRSSVRQIIAMAKDNHLAVRKSTAEALGTCGGSEVSPALLGLCRDHDISVRAEAVRALGKLKDSTTISAIMEAFKDPAPEVRAGAVEALGIVRDSRAIPTLYAAIKDESHLVRKKAQTALKQLTDLPLLIAALNDESTLVQANAAYVLWLMTGQDLGTDKAKWDAWLSQKNTAATPQK